MNEEQPDEFTEELDYLLVSIQGGYQTALDELERGGDIRQFLKNQANIDWSTSAMEVLRPYLRQPMLEPVALTESERSELVQAMAARINFASGEHDWGDSGIYGGGLDVEQASAALNAVLERFELRRRE